MSKKQNDLVRRILSALRPAMAEEEPEAPSIAPSPNETEAERKRLMEEEVAKPLAQRVKERTEELSPQDEALLPTEETEALLPKLRRRKAKEKA